MRSRTPSLNSAHICFRTLSNPPFFLNESRSLSMAACCAADSGRSSALNFFRFKDSISSAGLLVPAGTSSIAWSVAIVVRTVQGGRGKGTGESRVQISDNMGDDDDGQMLFRA
jgi:hypothetical protein